MIKSIFNYFVTRRNIKQSVQVKQDIEQALSELDSGGDIPANLETILRKLRKMNPHTLPSSLRIDFLILAWSLQRKLERFPYSLELDMAQYLVMMISPTSEEEMINLYKDPDDRAKALKHGLRVEV